SEGAAEMPAGRLLLGLLLGRFLSGLFGGLDRRRGREDVIGVLSARSRILGRGRFLGASLSLGSFRGIGRGRLGGLLDEGELELQGDLVADEHTTGIELRIPGHAPVLAVDAAGALESGAEVAE